MCASGLYSWKIWKGLSEVAAFKGLTQQIRRYGYSTLLSIIQPPTQIRPCFSFVISFIPHNKSSTQQHLHITSVLWRGWIFLLTLWFALKTDTFLIATAPKGTFCCVQVIFLFLLWAEFLWLEAWVRLCWDYQLLHGLIINQ